MATDWLITQGAAAEMLPSSPARRWAEVIRNGSMSAGLYAPRCIDDQRPHNQDELYVVLSGHGTFVRGDERRPFGPGDLIFVPAGMVHRFEAFTDDLAVWAMFWGPHGGEG